MARKMQLHAIRPFRSFQRLSFMPFLTAVRMLCFPSFGRPGFTVLFPYPSLDGGLSLAAAVQSETTAQFSILLFEPGNFFQKLFNKLLQACHVIRKLVHPVIITYQKLNHCY